MYKRSVLTGALFAMIAVILGAFGAHSLKAAAGMTPETLQTFDTGVRYQFYHALALILLGILIKISGEHKLLRAAYWLFVTGILFFSGSLYFLSTQGILGTDLRVLGPITPLGGLCFITGWLMLVLFMTKKQIS